MQQLTKAKKALRQKLRIIQKKAIAKGIDLVLIGKLNNVFNFEEETKNYLSSINNKLIILVGAAILSLASAGWVVQYVLSARCLLPINHLVWEATRPLADCSYCANVTNPIILQNITRRSFKKYAYSSKPIIVKQAVSHWRAMKEFNFYLFKNLYAQTFGSYESFDDGCQFLNFKTDLFTLQEVFEMPSERVTNEPGQEPWYVGWGNCHPDILAQLRRYYSVPKFLPKDAEFPATENIFFGYEMGAVLHLDYIPRLMWQGQVRGIKTWSIIPVPECEDVCQKFQYYVEPGDVVLLDTRLWYHSTSISKGQFALTVQSEYG